MTDKDTIGIASDHAGYELKGVLKAELASLGFPVLDLGTNSAEASVDYPDFGRALAEAIKAGKVDGLPELAIDIDGTTVPARYLSGSGSTALVFGYTVQAGQTDVDGIAIAANRHPGIRCGVVHDETSARLTRQHNDANVIALGARLTGVEVAKASLRVFLSTAYEGGRHAQRVAKLA